jgi:dolichol-phosphate mannosyltransferase
MKTTPSPTGGRTPPEGADDTRLTFRRSAVFSIVGLIGIGVQLAALWLLKGRLGVPLLVATFLATEIAVLHNFAWHVHWTWADRPASARETFWRLIRFHITNGLVSIIGNLLLMMLLTVYLRLHYLVANLISIGVCALVNLLVSHTWVFRPVPDRTGSADPRRAEDLL